MAKFYITNVPLYFNETRDIQMLSDDSFVVEAGSAQLAAEKLQGFFEKIAEEGFVVEPANDEQVVGFAAQVNMLQHSFEIELPPADKTKLRSLLRAFEKTNPTAMQVREQLHCSVETSERLARMFPKFRREDVAAK
jgi:hypothetical protein